MKGPDISLHELVRDSFRKLENSKDMELLWAPECGGNQRLTLFRTPKKSRETQVCWVDGIVLGPAAVKVIVEIEEGRVAEPTQLIGKLGAASFARFFIHKSKLDRPIPICHGAHFIQIVNTARLEPGSKKTAQWAYLEQNIRRELPIFGSGIRGYRLLWGDTADFSPNGKQRGCIAEYIQHMNYPE